VARVRHRPADLAVLLTTDAGTRWSLQSTLPAAGDVAAASNYLGPLSFEAVSVRQLVVASVTATSVLIYRSVDEGRLWQRTTLRPPFLPAAVALSFGSARDGWMLVAGFPALSGSRVALFQTGDGGLHWQARGSLQTSGIIPDGFTFSGQDGFLTGQNHGAQADILLETTDGGRTWVPTSFPLAARIATNADTEPVVVYGRIRVVPLVLYAMSADGAGLLLERIASRGGASAMTPLILKGVDPSSGVVLAVASVNVAYVVGRHALSRTMDGGTRWAQLGHVDARWTALDFPGVAQGYAIDADLQIPVSWRTDDGGQHFRRIVVRVSGG
jgi:photosystem II stability/assembly factor-like uncharacterized protein